MLVHAPPAAPLNALKAFEATARHLSFSKAAEELHVTPAALSHQIRGLEDLLALKLFHRRARAIELTAAARLMYPGIRSAFESLRTAVEQLDRAQQDRILVVSASPGLTAKWLVPRIYRFLDEHPDIDARITSSVGFSNFTTDGVDVGIRLSSGVHPDLHVEKLSDEWMLPLCSPRLLEGERPLRSPHDLPRFPLIQIDLPGMVPTWDDWLGAVGIAGIDTTRGLRLNVADHALDAASEGAGVVLGLQARRLARHRSRPPGDAVRTGAAVAGTLLSFRLRQGAGDAADRQGLSRLAVCRDRGHLRHIAPGRCNLGSKARDDGRGPATARTQNPPQSEITVRLPGCLRLRTQQLELLSRQFHSRLPALLAFLGRWIDHEVMAGLRLLRSLCRAELCLHVHCWASAQSCAFEQRQGRPNAAKLIAISNDGATIMKVPTVLPRWRYRVKGSTWGSMANRRPTGSVVVRK